METTKKISLTIVIALFVVYVSGVQYVLAILAGRASVEIPSRACIVFLLIAPTCLAFLAITCYRTWHDQEKQEDLDRKRSLAQPVSEYRMRMKFRQLYIKTFRREKIIPSNLFRVFLIEHGSSGTILTVRQVLPARQFGNEHKITAPEHIYTLKPVYVRLSWVNEAVHVEPVLQKY